MEYLNLEHIINNETKITKDKVYAIQGFVEKKGKINKTLNSIILRQSLNTIQCSIDKENEELTSTFSNLTSESYVTLKGTFEENKNQKTTIKNFELKTESIEIIETAQKQLPFILRDADSSIDEANFVNFNKCLDYKALFLRSKICQASFKLKSFVMNSFRSFLLNDDFTEIVTPKLLGGGSEGGANVFEVKYFKKKAFLAQSPQLYKQMAIIGGFKKVFEIGHVYRQEESNINRYLSEFTGMDIEMESNNYLNTIDFIYKLFFKIITETFEQKKLEIEILRKYKNFEDIQISEDPIVYSHKECVTLLKNNNIQIDFDSDFSREQEKSLGNLIKLKHKVDFFVVKDYPANARAFYTERYDEVDPETNVLYSKSYDFILRGEEILSGAQRISNYDKLKKSASENGIPEKNIKGYLESFKFGVPTHSGCGIGLERFLKSLFDFNDIRYFNMFPRDTSRLYP